MEELIASLTAWDQILPHLLKLGVAFVLTLPIAINREKSTQIMGLRTFPLVAVASCSYLLIILSLTNTSANAQARVLQGLITGIGFVGGGAILKNDGAVKGTATAASIWATGAVGAAVAFGNFHMALLISAITFIVLRLFTPLKTGADQDGDAIS
jgi:putative Mg2+ transporter-C (MgtC) family protein